MKTRSLLILAACSTTHAGPLSRAAVVRSTAATFGFSLPMRASAHAGIHTFSLSLVDAASASTVALLKEARQQLEPCASMIRDGSWDGVRTVVKTAPLASVKKIITQYITERGEAAEDLVIPREDLVQSLQVSAAIHHLHG